MPQRAVTPKGRITGRLPLPATGTYMVMWTATVLHILHSFRISEVSVVSMSYQFLDFGT